MQKLANQDYKDGFTTELSKIQKQILKYINSVGGKAHVKVIILNAGSYGESTVRENVGKLLKMDLLEETRENTFKVREKALSHI